MPFATAPFKGKIREVEVRRQWASLSFDGNKFWVKPEISKNFSKFQREYEKFCIRELKKIIRSGIASLRDKRVSVSLNYTDGKKTFAKQVKFSVNEYLKELKYSSQIDFKIGQYEKEWGINQINPRKKKFILFFNQNLIKYDSGKHIRHVVAHELAHVFVRDHGSEFHRVLAQLDSGKRQSEDFFSRGIVNVFQNSNLGISNRVFIIILAIALILVLGLWIYNFLLDLFSFRSSGPF